MILSALILKTIKSTHNRPLAHVAIGSKIMNTLEGKVKIYHRYMIFSNNLFKTDLYNCQYTNRYKDYT